MEPVILIDHHKYSCRAVRHEKNEVIRHIALCIFGGILMLACSFSAYAELIQKTDTISVAINFRQGQALLDTAYMANGQALREFAKVYHSLTCDSAHINIYGYASPEGTARINKSLSQRRADAIARFLIDHLSVNPEDITKVAGGVDWIGLYKAVEADQSVPLRLQVLDIIKSVNDTVFDAHGKVVGGRQKQLMDLNYGRPWSYMYRKIFPRLRGAYADVFCMESFMVRQRPSYDISSADAQVVTLDVDFPISSIIPEINGVLAAPMAANIVKYPVVALRSNLLLPLLNVGVEVPVAKHWSLGADYYYPWLWPAKSNKNCFELTIISAEVRYWFAPDKGRQLPGKNYLQGHSIGAYGAWGYYDFEHNYKGHQGHGWSTGIDYLFALPIANDRLRLEFQLAFGAVWSPNAQPYTVYEYGGSLFRDPGIKKNFFYFGPTKAGVSLVLPLNRTVKTSTMVMQ